MYNIKELLRQNNPIIIPTNTVFGLMVLDNNHKRLAELKERPSEQKFSYLYNSLKEVRKEMLVIPPLRFIKKHTTVECFNKKGESIYVRIAHSRLQKDLTLDSPKLFTSANIHKQGNSLRAVRDLIKKNPLIKMINQNSRCSNRPSKIYLYKQKKLIIR